MKIEQTCLTSTAVSSLEELQHPELAQIEGGMINLSRFSVTIATGNFVIRRVGDGVDYPVSRWS